MSWRSTATRGSSQCYEPAADRNPAIPLAVAVQAANDIAASSRCSAAGRSVVIASTPSAADSRGQRRVVDRPGRDAETTSPQPLDQAQGAGGSARCRRRRPPHAQPIVRAPRAHSRPMRPAGPASRGARPPRTRSNGKREPPHARGPVRAPANRHTAVAVARASSGSPWALTSTCTRRSPGASSSSSSRSIGVSVGRGAIAVAQAAYRADRSTPSGAPSRAMSWSYSATGRAAAPAVRRRSDTHPSQGHRPDQRASPAGLLAKSRVPARGRGGARTTAAVSPQPPAWLSAFAHMSHPCYRPVALS